MNRYLTMQNLAGETWHECIPTYWGVEFQFGYNRYINMLQRDANQWN